MRLLLKDTRVAHPAIGASTAMMHVPLTIPLEIVLIESVKVIHERVLAVGADVTVHDVHAILPFLVLSQLFPKPSFGSA
jgi:hypothetical protein